MLRSGNLAGGKRAAELERSFARLHEAAHVIAASNGTTALVARYERTGSGRVMMSSPRR